MSSESHRRAEVLGALLGMTCAISTAAFLLCFREATSLAGRNSVVFAMLFWSAVLSSLVTLARLRTTPWPGSSWLGSALLLGALTIAGNVSLATALPLLGAGVTSTMMQLQVFFVALGAFVFLKEAVGASLLLGAVLAAAGFAFFALPGASSESLSVYGLLAGLATALSFSSMIVWTRKVIHDLDPVSLNAGRLWLAVLVMTVWPGVLHGASEMPLRGWLLALGAAAGGPFIGRLAIMYSLRYISAAKTKLWGMLSPVFAFLFVYLIYGQPPSAREVIGGLLIVGGVLLPTLYTLRNASRVDA